MKTVSKFGPDLLAAVRRDRNHPSLAIWGLLNEVGYLWSNEEKDAIYRAARDILPKIRDIDDSRLVFLSSGRFDEDRQTGSAANPGSRCWDVYLGGEDAQDPQPSEPLYDGAPYKPGFGDVHIYESFPVSWEFQESFLRSVGKSKPVFVSEGGQGSANQVIAAKRNLQLAGSSAQTWQLNGWVGKMSDGLEMIWKKYGLHDRYPNIEAMLVDSQLIAASQRARFMNLIRANKGINGYSLTSFLSIRATLMRTSRCGPKSCLPTKMCSMKALIRSGSPSPGATQFSGARRRTWLSRAEPIRRSRMKSTIKRLKSPACRKANMYCRRLFSTYPMQRQVR
jgi:hypothetical protein